MLLEMVVICVFFIMLIFSFAVTLHVPTISIMLVTTLAVVITVLAVTIIAPIVIKLLTP